MSKTTTSGRRTIWITDRDENTLKDRYEHLKNLGFDIIYANSLAEFGVHVAAGRPGTIILDTLAQPQEVLKIISNIAGSPELSAARCILNITRANPEACKAAMSANFRDILPWKISPKLWTSRIHNSVSPKTIEETAAPCAISMNHPASLRIPGRIIWMNETHVRIECRGAYRPGTIMHVTGPIAAAMGAAHISLIVERIHKDKLLYRYSQAIIAKWGVPADVLERARALVRRLKADSPGPRLRVFVGINNAQWRKLTVDSLDPSRFEVNVAMQRANMPSEFLYFSPDLVIFDDKVANNLKPEELLGMFSKVSDKTPLVVVGKDLNLDRLKQILGERPIIVERELIFETFATADKKYNAAPKDVDLDSGTNTVHFLSDHPLSKAELEISARLRSLSPNGGILALPFSLGTFALARIESPIIKKALGRNAYLKITGSEEGKGPEDQPQFSNDSTFKFSDVDSEDRIMIASTILQTATDYYSKHYGIMPRGIFDSDEKNKLDVPIDVSEPPLDLPEDQDQPSQDEDEEEKNDQKEANRPKSSGQVRIDYSKGRQNPGFSIDPILAKALGLFVIAAIIMGFVIYAAMRVDESSYKDHGKVYGEFFKRMKDPEYRKANPAPGWEKIDEYEKAIKDREAERSKQNSPKEAVPEGSSQN